MATGWGTAGAGSVHPLLGADPAQRVQGSLLQLADGSGRLGSDHRQTGLATGCLQVRPRGRGRGDGWLHNR